MSNIYFEHPYLLFLLPVALFCLFRCLQQEDSILFSNISFLKQSSKKLSFLTLFQSLTLLFFIISISSPYKSETYLKNIPINSSEVIAVDISGSMEESFQEVKKILKSYLTLQKSSLVSLVFFGDGVAITSPLTDDIEFLKKGLETIKVGDLGEMDTKLYDAIAVSKKLLKDAPTKKNSILVLTDGIDKNSATSLNTLLSVTDKNITINTIGFGEDFDKEVLKTISKKSGGVYKSAKDTTKLKKLLLDRDDSKTIQKTYTKKEPLYQLPLFFAFLSLLFYLYLLNKRSSV